MNHFIPLSVPNIRGNEKKYVNEALDTEWVSSGGPHIEKFEKNFADYLNIDYACACQSGTAGLHLCLVALGIEQDDIVLVPSLTFIATINSVMYQKATPVFFDCDQSLGINTIELTRYLENECTIQNNQVIETKSGRTVKAIMPVHVFGNICHMEEIVKIAKKYNLYVIEDATEALGSYYTNGPFTGQYAGTIGDVGVFSFNGNKIITTGGGGMVVSKNKQLIDKIRYLSTQAKDDTVYFVHNEIGFNYRLTNVQAALGLGQLEQLEQFIQIKNENYQLYKELLKESNLGYILDFDSSIRPNYWFYTFVLNQPNAILRDQLIQYLKENNVQTRPIWKLNHTQKPFLNYQMYGGKKAQLFYDSAINIPCSSNLTQKDVKRVAQLLIDFENKL